MTIATTTTTNSNSTLREEDRNCKNYRNIFVDCTLLLKISKLACLHQKQKYWPERKASSSLQIHRNNFRDTLRTISTLQLYGMCSRFWSLLYLNGLHLSRSIACQHVLTSRQPHTKEHYKALLFLYGVSDKPSNIISYCVSIRIINCIVITTNFPRVYPFRIHLRFSYSCQYYNII